MFRTIDLELHWQVMQPPAMCGYGPLEMWFPKHSLDFKRLIPKKEYKISQYFYMNYTLSDNILDMLSEIKY